MTISKQNIARARFLLPRRICLLFAKEKKNNCPFKMPKVALFIFCRWKCRESQETSDSEQEQPEDTGVFKT